jgi:hypothetical protein
MAIGTKKIENYVPVVRLNQGIYTAYDITTLGNVTAANLTTSTNNIALTGTLSVAGATTLDTVKFKRNVLASSGNTTMTTAMSGSVMLIDGASTDYALPAISASDVGMQFLFVSTIISTGTQTITAQAGDLLTGGVIVTAADTPTADSFVPDVSDDLILTINGTTTGGATVGSWVEYTAISATRWFVRGNLYGVATAATPFS